MTKLHIDIAEPCSADWDGMNGGRQRRHCQACDKAVHDLSTMTEPEVFQLLEQPAICVRFQPNEDGSVRFGAPRRLRTAAAAAGLLAALPNAGCQDAEASAAVTDDTPGLITQAATALYDWLMGDDGEALPRDEVCDINEDFEVPLRRDPVMGGASELIVSPPATEPEPTPTPQAEPDARLIRLLGGNTNMVTGVVPLDLHDELLRQELDAKLGEAIRVELPTEPAKAAVDPGAEGGSSAEGAADEPLNGHTEEL